MSWANEVLSAFEEKDDAKTEAAWWMNDPLGFIELAWPDLDLAAYQGEVLAMLPTEHKVSVRGPRGLGKTMVSALAILWFAISREQAGIDWKVVTTSGSWLQLRTFLWPEVHRWAKAIDWDALGVDPWQTEKQILKLSISLDAGIASAASPQRPELIEGAHAKQLMVVFDESKVIAPEVFNSVEGAASGQGVDGQEFFALAVSTPGAPIGKFYDIHKRKPGLEDWWVRHVTLEEAVAAGRISPEFGPRLAKIWGETSSEYIQHVLGEFAADDEYALIPLSWVERAMERWREWEAAPIADKTIVRVGVDVARHGSDETVIATVNKDAVVMKLDSEAYTDNVSELGDDIHRAIPHTAQITVDTDGLGAGTADRLRQLGRNVEMFHGAPQPKEWRDKSGELEAASRRSAAWWRIRELLDPAKPLGLEIALPPDDMLIGDLTAPRKVSDPKGRIKVESKDSVKARLHRSPDRADAIVYAMWREPEPIPEPKEEMLERPTSQSTAWGQERKSVGQAILDRR